MELSGVVERQHVARGSKSDRIAVVLVTPRRRYWLRRRGEHPFEDPILDRLVGFRLRGEGSLSGPWFTLDRWETIGGDGTKGEEGRAGVRRKSGRGSKAGKRN